MNDADNRLYSTCEDGDSMFEMLMVGSVILVMDQAFSARGYYALDGGIITSTVSLVITLTAVAIPALMLMISLVTG